MDENQNNNSDNKNNKNRQSLLIIAKYNNK